MQPDSKTDSVCDLKPAPGSQQVDKEFAIKKTLDFLEELKKSGIAFQAAWLFGIYAKGKQHAWSDIDVAIFSDDFTGVGFNDKKDIAPVNVRKEFVDIEVKTYPSKALLRPDPFVKQILEEGIRLIGQD
jgi:predicted nucleotidyltransferase